MEKTLLPSILQQFNQCFLKLYAVAERKFNNFDRALSTLVTTRKDGIGSLQRLPITLYLFNCQPMRYLDTRA